MSEVANIAEVASKVSKDIFKWFKWERIPRMDENFPCHKVDQHKKKSKKKNSQGSSSHTHPVDVVFKYYDPYLDKVIMMNTDLKSYAKKSISKAMVTGALTSLAKTIDCARSSTDWQRKYVLDQDPFEIRGMLFVYNHDGEYDNDFLKLYKDINTERIGLKKDQLLHVIDPQRIRYLRTVVADMMQLHTEGHLPKEKYTFLYPDLYLRKAQGNSDQYPATIEMICSPYMILKHDPFPSVDENTQKTGMRCLSGGYVIYYNQNGSTEFEFIYLFDALSRFQILSSKSSIKLRVAHYRPNNEIMSNFKKAIELYVRWWGCDEFKKRDLDRIEFEIVNQTSPFYMPGKLAWRYE